ncbi:WD repeat-containing protein 48-like [Dorcoceras hygrometricum]|uniref:WD repeat-containing protein 48-like n=1 Tax=Dorcoceras hygrometricum TaxID=472368 RepID=A0A2Z7ATI1_9LAMI|nr:WD repeat-containing protein 48-like [Dorcoceras hygrometricum]
MQGIKATTESREPKDLNNSSIARSDQTKDRQWPLGILSTWELPYHLQYTVPDAHKQLHLLLPTHEMWELPSPLIAANNPNREMRYTGITRSSSSSEVYGNYPLVLKHRILIATMTSRAHRSTTCSTATHKTTGIEAQKIAAGSYELHQRYHTSLTHQKALNKLKGRIYTYPKKLGAKSDAYANRLHKGDVFAHLTSFKQTFESNIQTKCLSKRSPTLPLSLSSELSLTQLTLTQLTAESSSPIQNAVVPTNPNDDVLAPVTEHASALSTAQRLQISLRLLNTTIQRQLLTSPLLNANMMGSVSQLPAGQRKNEKHVPGDDQYDEQFKTMTFIGCFVEYLAGNSCLAPTGFVKKMALHDGFSSSRLAGNDFPAARGGDGGGALGRRWRRIWRGGYQALGLGFN